MNKPGTLSHMEKEKKAQFNYIHSLVTGPSVFDAYNMPKLGRGGRHDSFYFVNDLNVDPGSWVGKGYIANIHNTLTLKIHFSLCQHSELQHLDRNYKKKLQAHSLGTSPILPR